MTRVEALVYAIDYSFRPLAGMKDLTLNAKEAEIRARWKESFRPLAGMKDLTLVRNGVMKRTTHKVVSVPSRG